MEFETRVFQPVAYHIEGQIRSVLVDGTSSYVVSAVSAGRTQNLYLMTSETKLSVRFLLSLVLKFFRKKPFS